MRWVANADFGPKNEIEMSVSFEPSLGWSPSRPRLRCMGPRTVGIGLSCANC